MWHKSRPLFSDSVNTGRNITKLHRPIFSYGKGVTKKPSDVNDVSRSKNTYEQRENHKLSDREKESFLKNAKTIKSKTGNAEENKWMWTLMHRARQI